jgi:ABC-type multidrug transport system ATPase subunit
LSDPDLELTQELNVEAEMLPAAPGAQGATSVLVVKGLECISPAPAGLPCMPKKENKKVLSGVSLEIPGGDVMAIIGPSDGDGTVLLNALSLEKTSTVAYGVLELDGVPITPANYAHLCSYVPNAETLWPMMTARKHLEYAFRLMRPDLTGAAMVKAVDELLLATGMVSCQHTKAGDALRQGLSGGQKRRLMMALGLVSRPKVLLLDEPTSGLDSAAAAAITRLLKDIALKNGTSILCTIQQPSAAVYAKFDRLLLLSMGRVAYSGTRIDAAGYFAKIGKTFPAAANPAEFLVDEVSKDMTSIEAVEVVLDQWTKHASSVSPKLSPKQAKAKLHARQARAGLCTQIVVLTQRTFEMAFADPVIYLVRMFVVAFIITFFGIVYLESANQVQEQISFRLFFLWWLLCVPPALDIVAVFYYNIELQTARAEMKTGAYGIFAYVVANTAVQLPMMFALALCACIPGYGLGGFPWDNFVTFWIAYALSLWAFECLGQACALLRNPIIGILQFMNVWAGALIFTGLVFRGEDVIWPFRILIWLFPLRWLFNSAAYDIFVPAIYEGTLPCTYGSLVNTSTGPSMCFSDFYCPDVPLTQCAGRTGTVILKNLNRNYETLNDKDERGIDILIIIAIALVYKLIFCKGVADMSQHAAIKKPDGKLIARTASTSASVAMQANAEADDLSAA